MKAHMEDQHLEKWWEYDQSILEEKESLFECICPFKSTVNSHFGGSQTHLQFSSNKEIVEVMIGEMLFYPSGYGDVESS